MAAVLVVDDNQGVRKLLAETIRLMDIFVIEAADGPTALERAAKELPDVILLDVCMPGMDGFEVLTKLRENPATRHIEVVLITGEPADGGEWGALEAASSHHILKPWKAGVVEGTVRVALRASEASLLNGTKSQHSDDVDRNSESTKLSTAQ